MESCSEAARVDSAGWFVGAVEVLARAARARGLLVPSFRSPPRSGQLRRAIGHPPGGGVVVAVRASGRPRHEVALDLVDGLLVANGLVGPFAAALRGELLRELECTGPPPARAA